MRAVIQRVQKAKIVVNSKIISEIEQGLLVFVGVKNDDTLSDVEYLADKIVKLRIFQDEQGKLNLSAGDKNYSILVVPQFTLYGNCKSGNRPSFTLCAKPDIAKDLYEKFLQKLKSYNVDVKSGIFQEKMKVEIINDGPVTILLDSEKKF